MFDGKVRHTRVVSAAGKRSVPDKSQLLNDARKQREERTVARQRDQACVKLQAFYR